MLKKGFLFIGIIGLGVTACIKHEVIPAPTPTVDLYSHFQGTINGTDVEFTENVLGYTPVSTKAKEILPPPTPSSAIYYAEMSSPNTMQSVKVGMGKLYWDATLTADPTISLFNGYFTANLTPNYSTDANAGFEVTYRDQNSRIWKSWETSTYIDQDVEFTEVVQESDTTGDYSKFKCVFDCYVYSYRPDSLILNPPVYYLDSLLIEDATYRGWFKR